MSAGKAPAPLPSRRRTRPARDDNGRVTAAAAFGVRPGGRPEGPLRDLAIEAIERNPKQPRRRFDPTALAALADSIRERGVLQPVLVRPIENGRFELVAGERRWRAARQAGVTTIPAFVREADDTLTLELGLIENLVREDLTPIEEARTLVTLIEDLGVSQRALARRVGRSQPDISNTIRLLDLPDQVLELVEDGKLSKGHGKVLLSIDDQARRRTLAREAAASEWSVRDLERSINAQPQPPRGARRADVDAAALSLRLAERLEAALGAAVRVRARRAGGFAIQIAAANADEAEAIVARVAKTRG